MDDLVTVYESNESHQVHLMKHHLEEAGIETVLLDNTYSVYVQPVTIGEMFVCKLQVRKEDEQRAKEILKEYNE